MYAFQGKRIKQGWIDAAEQAGLEISTGAPPGTQTQDTSLGVLYELVC